ncbi:hypothetical protein GW17_00035774 [Ensete ventricosum]|nr:hypothetical protein GW17_00035774 [Ensete ventricosum]
MVFGNTTIFKIKDTKTLLFGDKEVAVFWASVVTLGRSHGVRLAPTMLFEFSLTGIIRLLSIFTMHELHTP